MSNVILIEVLHNIGRAGHSNDRYVIRYPMSVQVEGVHRDL